MDRPGVGALLQRRQEAVPTFGLALLVGFLIVWAGYRFSFGRIPFADISLPFPGTVQGIQQVRDA